MARESRRMVAGKVLAGVTLKPTNQTPITSHRQRRVRRREGIGKRTPVLYCTTLQWEKGLDKYRWE